MWGSEGGREGEMKVNGRRMRRRKQGEETEGERLCRGRHGEGEAEGN